MDYLQYYASFTISAFVIVKVLNLIINGLPSIQLDLDAESVLFLRFKPYYKWITFNTTSNLVP